MTKLLAAVFATLLYVYAYSQAVDGLAGVGGFKTIGSCSQSVTYFARTTASHTSGDALDTFICIGLVGNSLWTKIDVLYVFAQPNSTDALLNLKQNAFNGTLHGAPIFSANAGFTGTDASSTVYIDTGFNASTAGGQYTQNAAHISVWNLTGTQSSAGGGAEVGVEDNSSNLEQISPYYSDGTSTAFINAGGGHSSFVDSTALGHRLGVRTSASSQAIYKNAVSQGTDATSSIALINLNFFVLARNHNGSAESGDGRQAAIVTIGGTLSGADITNLCHAENAYLNAVTGIALGTC